MGANRSKLAIEDDPDGEIGGEVFKMMRATRRHKEERARVDGVAASAIEEIASASGNEVELRSSVGFLGIVTLRSVEFDLERLMGEDRHGQVWGWRGPFGQGFQE